ncbi:hypothetical protein ANN_06598 [Periplaneta americana]|uniref:Uncharacterized protein n=1 Tax=Periplaneta americana TaxID=6978 RepID=A0ABQ8TF85_PERAM|nr:hypothetical protein ANN_06598 [Periplaneta americana]
MAGLYEGSNEPAGSLKAICNHLENYMDPLYPHIHSSSEDWVTLNLDEAARYLPQTEESVQMACVYMKRKVLQNPKEAVKQWSRLKLFQAEIVDEEISAQAARIWPFMAFGVVGMSPQKKNPMLSKLGTGQPGAPVLFAGGPVWALAWCPVPLQQAIYRDAEVDQYLALSCHAGMENTYLSGHQYAQPGLIQIWNFGHLDNLKLFCIDGIDDSEIVFGEMRSGIRQRLHDIHLTVGENLGEKNRPRSCSIPEMVLGIAHEYGVVWCMEWCPSGCYDMPNVDIPDNRLRRLGLLAAACSDGTIRIFSVCFPTELANEVADRVPILKTEAMCTLVLDDSNTCLLENSNWQCTRLSWYKGKGHRIIAGAFTNGMVALWDLASESPLLCKKTGKSYTMYPYHCFQAHIGVVSDMIDLKHMNEGIKKHDSSAAHINNNVKLAVLGQTNIQTQLDSIELLNFTMIKLPRTDMCVRFCGAFELALRALALSPHSGGRFMMTGSFDRTTKFWDLEDTSAPITINKRGSVTDGVWLTHWVSTVSSYDDGYALGHANGTLNPVRNFGFSNYPLLAQNSVVWSLSTCDWVNAVAQGTLAGELAVIFSHQLLIAVCTEKGMKNKRMITLQVASRNYWLSRPASMECSKMMLDGFCNEHPRRTYSEEVFRLRPTGGLGKLPKQE